MCRPVSFLQGLKLNGEELDFLKRKKISKRGNTCTCLKQ